MKCPSCGSEDERGNFCSRCGAALDGACAACGAGLAPGSRFCTQCGEPVAAAAGRGVRGLGWPWLVAIGAVVLVILVFMIPRRAERAGPPAMTTPDAGAGPAVGAPAGGAGALSGDMRTNADRLFNRIMGAAERGDSAEVARFMPMAVQAYGLVEDLDADGLYHLAILHLTGGDAARASQAADRILEDEPDHILALGVAATAARRAGDEARARALYRRLLDAYPTEAARRLPEYVDHQPMLPEYRRAAREALGETG